MNSIDKKFVNYFNDFYGPNGIYPTKDRKIPISKQEIEKGLFALMKRKKGHKFEGDSVDRELIRDEMIKLKLINPNYSKNESVNMVNKSSKRLMLENKLRKTIRPVVKSILKEGTHGDKSYQLNKEEYNYLLPALRKKLSQQNNKYYFIGSYEELEDMLSRLKGFYDNFDDKLSSSIVYKCSKEVSIEPFRKTMKIKESNLMTENVNSYYRAYLRGYEDGKTGNFSYIPDYDNNTMQYWGFGFTSGKHNKPKLDIDSLEAGYLEYSKNKK